MKKTQRPERDQEIEADAVNIVAALRAENRKLLNELAEARAALTRVEILTRPLL